jgi:hypothetical protein
LITLTWSPCFHHPSCVNSQGLSSLRITALSFLFGLYRPFAEARDHDRFPLAEIILNEIKKVLNDTDAIFPGDIELMVSRFDDVNFSQAHDDSPFLWILPMSDRMDHCFT